MPLSRKKGFEDRLISIDNRISDLQVKLEKIYQNKDKDTEVMIGLLKKYSHAETVTNEMVNSFIEAVYVTDNEHIEIIWKFKDRFPEFMKEN